LWCDGDKEREREREREVVLVVKGWRWVIWHSIWAFVFLATSHVLLDIRS
jgi:hypothetical protein